MAIKLEGVQCKAGKVGNDWSKFRNIGKLYMNDIICGGAKREDGRNYCFWGNSTGTLLSRCRMSQADSAFMFLTAIVVAVAAVFGFLRMKRGY